jgi:hypothetical protein
MMLKRRSLGCCGMDVKRLLFAVLRRCDVRARRFSFPHEIYRRQSSQSLVGDQDGLPVGWLRYKYAGGGV